MLKRDKYLIGKLILGYNSIYQSSLKYVPNQS